jgi:hypothetical protein
MRQGGDDLQRILLEQEGIQFNDQERIIHLKECIWCPQVAPAEVK